MAKIYSMLSNDLVVTKTAKSDKKKAVAKAKIEQAIIIKGGANVADAKQGGRAAKFVETTVTAAELKILKEHPSFMRRVEKGFITIDQEPTFIKKDKSAQITEKEMKAKTDAAISTGEAEA